MALLDVAGAMSLRAAVPTEPASNHKEENRVFSHVMIGTNDIVRSKSFYDALIGAIGGTPGVQDLKGRLIYAHRGGRFLITKPIDGEAATHANGGTAIEDAPGVRQGSSSSLYLAYLRDPDGNKLCALHRMAA